MKRFIHHCDKALILAPKQRNAADGCMETHGRQKRTISPLPILIESFISRTTFRLFV